MGQKNIHGIGCNEYMVCIGGAPFARWGYIIGVDIGRVGYDAIAGTEDGIAEYFVIIEVAGEDMAGAVAVFVEFCQIHCIYCAPQAIMEDICRQAFAALKHNVTATPEWQMQTGYAIGLACGACKEEDIECDEYNRQDEV